ncbi:MAG: two-component sensor histidine kinase [Planctomycetes bacterium]|nr:two-component sensor histidine kinase [Planctomycetota bacterium]
MAESASNGGFFSSDSLPHATRSLDRPDIIWLHVISDACIAAAYYAIPIILFSFIARRRDVPFNWMFGLFGVFFLACGTTQVMEIATVWWPVHAWSGLMKCFTALVSIIAAISLIPIMPKALALPGLKRANEQLSATSVALARSNRELEQFAYVAAHDLQEPLRMVAMYVDMLDRRRGDVLDAEAREWVAHARAGANRMRGLIDDLLAYTRVDQDRSLGEISDAAEAAREAIESLRPQIAASRTDVAIGALPRVRCSHPQLVQVFQNLIGNAIKYGTRDKPWVHITALADGGSSIFAVQDNGIGIEATHHERIFEVFQRLHRRDQYPGTGIGLSICTKIIERHGGRLWVESQVGTGSVFRFSLSLAGD